MVFLNAADLELAAEGLTRPFFADIVFLFVFFIFLFFMTGRNGQDILIIGQLDIFLGHARQIRRQDVFIFFVFYVDLRNAVGTVERLHKIAEEMIYKIIRKY